VPSDHLNEQEHSKNNLPDTLSRWRQRHDAERKRSRTEQSFCVSKADIAKEDYELSLNRYKKVVQEKLVHIAPKKIIGALKLLEDEIQRDLAELDRIV
jgi:type I restriction enzyme M protein